VNQVLIVDDDPWILEALQELLRDRYEVAVACDGEEALERLGGSSMDVVVLDLAMPRMDGEDALREIRGRGWSVPVILTSARGDRLGEYRALGADDFLQKPFEARLLEEKIERLLYTSRAT
jgi:DNA-binding response OmpR family regulator